MNWGSLVTQIRTGFIALFLVFLFFEKGLWSESPESTALKLYEEGFSEKVLSDLFNEGITLNVNV